MKTIIPTMQGTIDRRILVNFHVRPGVIRKLLPSYFRPKLVKGWAMAGVCLIRLKDLRPRGFPAACGFTSENAAHRIAVEWDEDGVSYEGVFIPRRDTSSVWQAFVGGRLFPGVHHLSKFTVNETNDEFQLQMDSRDGTASIELCARRDSRIWTSSLFTSLAEASEFFARGSIGWSAAKNPDCCDGLELHTSRWQVEPLEVQSLKSSFFTDRCRFPNGSIQFDCALLMQNIEHEWHVLPRMENPDLLNRALTGTTNQAMKAPTAAKAVPMGRDRTPKRFASTGAIAVRASVLECAQPPGAFAFPQTQENETRLYSTLRFIRRQT